jgi:GH18 family chitinase
MTSFYSTQRRQKYFLFFTLFSTFRSSITFLRQYNFDGLDFDWEYPTLRQGGRPQDRANYALLIKVNCPSQSCI